MVEDNDRIGGLGLAFLLAAGLVEAGTLKLPVSWPRRWEEIVGWYLRYLWWPASFPSPSFIGWAEGFLRSRCLNTVLA